VAAANQLDAKVTDVPEEIKRQGKKAGMAWQVNQLRQEQAKVVKVVHDRRKARNAQAAARAKKTREQDAVAWQEGQLAWLEDQPYANATKFDRKLLRSKIVKVTKVDAVRRRAKVCDWETNRPHKGYVPFRRMSMVHGIKDDDRVEAEPTASDAPVAKPKKKSMVKQHTFKPVMEVVTDFGIIIDVNSLVDGRRVVLAEDDGQGHADMTKPVLNIEEAWFPDKGVVQRAWKLKHRQGAPRSFYNKPSGEAEKTD
jgi:hypothetical protein